ncbi:MAG TPA: cytochrome c biogenesis protein ResB, partial [Candidatus Binatia bacterium]|nr:cytochrome c biogenesis protein ResB [Candidatus Binatia bacterium]
RPAPVIEIRAADGSLLWDGPVALTDTADNAPYTTMGIPGTPLGLQLELQSDANGVATLVAVPYEVTGTNPDGTLVTQNLFPMALGIGDTARSPDTGLSMTLDRVEGATIIIAEQDPGAYIVWVAFLSLISGLLITFYLPRRRVWTRVGADGELWIVGRSDRYVDFEGEFGRLLDDLVKARTPAADPATAAGATAAG